MSDSPLNAWINLHTRIANSLFKGSYRPGKWGLLQFATHTAQLWRAVKYGDPYAEWYLLKIYDALSAAHEKLAGLEKQLNLQLMGQRGIQIIANETYEFRYPLSFASPFGYMGAYLLIHFDNVILQFVTLKRFGIFVNDHANLIDDVIKIVWQVFSLSSKWRNTGVTRKDIIENNPIAIKAKELLGDLPDAILQKKITFTFMPKQIKEN